MDEIYFSFIIPVFNRPDEVDELLLSLTQLEGSFKFEVVLIEDGSNITCKAITDKYNEVLNISYYFKENSGPGDSRNYGMLRAKGNYFIILDSDCLLPKQYLKVVSNYLKNEFADCYGGPDAAHSSFSSLQKAINFAMTSFITTGGIRGNKTNIETFQPRSFNMGLSKKAFEDSKGFGIIHPGEDPDLSIRLNKLAYKTKLFVDAYVYHKRRISWSKFYKQVNKFGLVRPILNQWHPQTDKIIYWLPTLFILGLILSILLLFLDFKLPIILYAVYFITAFVLALFKTKSLVIAMQSILAIFIQFFGYGYGFLKSTFYIKILKQKPEKQFPFLFFKNAN